MKKTLFLFFSLYALLNLEAQTTAITDTNFEQFLVDQAIDTNGLNGNILDADAQAVTDLIINRNDITDFTGIEAFINIETLNVGTNDFGTIQLNTLSQLRNFRINNTNNLSSLDFTQNPNLENLYIRTNSNQPLVTLSELDLSQNLNLVSFQVLIMESLSSVIFPVTDTIEGISLSVVAIPVIDLSQITGEFSFRIVTSRVDVNIIYPNDNMALKSLDLSSIIFPSVDVSSQIGLESFSLSSTNTQEITLPSTSTLTRINISGHELRPTTSFASVPELSSLSITHKRDADPLEVDISQNLELTSLNLSYNNMENLDVTQNTKLTRLEIDNNNLTNIDISQNVDLTNLNFSSNQIPSINVSLNTELSTLNGTNNLLPSINVSTNVELRYLYLGFNQLPNLDITNNTVLWILDINNNLFTGSGLDLSQNTELFTLDISNNQVETLDFSNTVMRSLNISYNIFPGNQVLNDFYSKIAARGNLSAVTLIANNNLLTDDLPDFYSIYTDNDPTTTTHKRWSLYIENNYFHFGDFEDEHLDYVNLLSTQSSGNSPDVVMSNYNYAPQEKVNTIENLTPNAGESITLTTTVRGAQNHYQWFKDGIPIADAIDSPEYTITNLNTCDNGVYHSEITSDLIPFENSNPQGTAGKNLLLIRNDITLKVNATKGCVSLDMPLTDVPINSGIQWNENPGACGYKLSIGTTSGGTDILNTEDVRDITLYNPENDFPANTDIYITITPYYDDGDFTGCTEESFTTNASKIPAECSSLIYPENNAADISVSASISWNPANAADGYKLTVGTTSGGNDILDNEDVSNVLTHDFLNDFNYEDMVYVTITPYNTDEGDATGCIEESFTIETITVTTPTAPNCTILNSPVNTATDVAINLSEITWNPVSDATQYRITVNGSTSDLNDITDEIVSGTSYTFINNFDNGETVTVTITPLNGTLEPTTTCTSESFTIINTITPTAPTCTTLSSPINGDTDVAINLNEITWSPASNATQYRISVNGSTSNLNDITDEIVSGTSYAFTNNFDNGETVTVTITPLNGSLESITTCTSESFTTETLGNNTPNCTSLTSPINGANNVLVSTNLSWNTVTDAIGYYVKVGTTFGGSEIIQNEDIVYETTFDLISDLPENTQIYISITPYNTSGEATACTTESFTTETLPIITPSCTSLTTPINGDINVEIDTNLSWIAATDTTGYRISVGTTSGGHTIVNDEDVGDTTSYDFITELDENTTYFVTITAYNASIDATGCMEVSFTTEELIEDLILEESKYGFSPNGDGLNDFWEIKGIENSPNNVVNIYNRWGDLVFTISNYDNRSRVFRGEANKATSIGAGKLPNGTYFFDIKITGTHNLKTLKGFVVIKR